MKILNTETKEVIFESEEIDLKKTVEIAVKEHISLCRSDLRGANLEGANLRWANLRGSTFCDTNLNGAKIIYRGTTVKIIFQKEE